MTINDIFRKLRIFFAFNPFIKYHLCDACGWRKVNLEEINKQAEVDKEIKALKMTNQEADRTAKICCYCAKKIKQIKHAS